jgi:HsdM N-terminal domain
MNELALVQKVWNYAHVLRDQGVPYQAYISQISYLLFLKMDDERAGLVASGLIKGEDSAIPEDCRWPVLRDLQGEELTRRYSAILDKLSRLFRHHRRDISESAERDPGPGQAVAPRWPHRRRDLARARRRRQRLDL